MFFSRLLSSVSAVAISPSLSFHISSCNHRSLIFVIKEQSTRFPNLQQLIFKYSIYIDIPPRVETRYQWNETINVCIIKYSYKWSHMFHMLRLLNFICTDKSLSFSFKMTMFLCLFYCSCIYFM